MDLMLNLVLAVCLKLSLPQTKKLMIVGTRMDRTI